MQDQMVKKQRRRLHDFPELQVGYPERNDAGPNHEMERIHVDMDTLVISKKRAGDLAHEMGGRTSSHA